MECGSLLPLSNAQATGEQACLRVPKTAVNRRRNKGAIVSLMIPAGSIQLEANLREPKDSLRGGVVVCHPHPVYGGTMDNRIVYRTAKSAAAAGFAALRFNFRGVGQSTGGFDHGLGEKDDVAAAVRWMDDKYPNLPLALAGYSFGAWVGLQVGCREPRIMALAGLGLPLDLYNMDFLAEISKPSLYIVGTEDEFCSRESLTRLGSRLPAASSLQLIEGADHFFSEQTEIVEKLVFEFFDRLLPDRNRP